MSDATTDRNNITEFVKKELVGPWPTGDEIDCTKAIIFADAHDAYKPQKQLGSGDEILQRDAPTRRYGIGVLYPAGVNNREDADNINNPPPYSQPASSENNQDEDREIDNTVDQILSRIEEASDGGNADDLDLSLANVFRPSSMGITFFVEKQKNFKLNVSLKAGRYVNVPVQIAGQQRVWWLRSSLSIDAIFDGAQIAAAPRGKLRPIGITKNNCDGLKLNIELFVHAEKQMKEGKLVTLYVTNNTAEYTVLDAACIFQVEFKAQIDSEKDSYLILPYPEGYRVEMDKDELSLELLYREAMTYCIGHGCAGDWGAPNADYKVSAVSGEVLPTYETASITPELIDENGNKTQVSMAELAGLVSGKDGLDSVENVINGYDLWIRDKSKRLEHYPVHLHAVGTKHLATCKHLLGRMRAGFEYLKKDKQAFKAFQLANRAIYLQQLVAKRTKRVPTINKEQMRLQFSEPFEIPDEIESSKSKGFWRPFQIAFLLYSAKSSVDGKDPDRGTVELIWFPTGGGKTEAYLALAAFTIFMRRIRKKDDVGVQVLMRYTLRLLTTQQFQRAAKLICCMDHIRRENEILLGTDRFSIGIWLGSENTPNLRQQALKNYRELSGDKKFAQNLLLLDRCPWCSAQIGPLEKGIELGRGTKKIKVFGYEQQGDTIIFKCSDKKCEYANGIPVYVIDEDIYENQPTMIIGTVDKFAMLAWRPEARSIFGIDEHGNRVASPPGLIIQDELHLISGPLGSLVGLYEILIEELCTDRRASDSVIPKIVCSTATIRRYEEQIKNLYGRNNVSLFPPPGIDYRDSYFAQIAKNADGKPRPGRLYVGIHGPALGSMQTVQVRTFTALLQAPLTLAPEKRDPWWTLLVFFNSLRELGTTLSLLQSDIGDYFSVIRNRFGLERDGLRKYWKKIKELTSRLRNDEVPLAISELEMAYTETDNQAIDVCLASSIIEVGIDIDRLSTMAVVGQPKSTSQYIQVTGRVGRQWWDRPGVVFMLYNASKARDRSHFEKFRTYHEQLYAQVEPTSVTPFSAPVLDRALHAIMVAYARQTSAKEAVITPNPIPIELLRNLQTLLLARVKAIKPDQEEYLARLFLRRLSEWETWGSALWKAEQGSEDIPLMFMAGSYRPRGWENRTWSVPTSMRNVDAECQAEISQLYLNNTDNSERDT